ncbi:aldose epimerase family protein [Muricoccus pecuniae]|uniref:Aldose 1-epimerase n=1 Tax=Muricoccus pecuniae TaxID=693023 RepID=A0A840YD49_9PROT|nr:aldose epimerase [Roseomonas pecuniae]MBB5692432.1 aldose 1-epimerase [Roseomonas pecuniae]
MLEIAGGAWSAALLPAQGGALARLAHDGRDVLHPLPEGADPNNSWAGAFLMLPWTNRLDRGRLPYPGGVHHFPCNRVAEATALHGLSREHPWRIEEVSPGRAVLAQSIADGPYCYEARVEVALGETFSIALAVTNTGAEGTPFGTGWHPFFTRPPGTRLSFRAGGTLTRDARNLPTGCAPSDGLDGGEEVFGGLDTHFVGWDGNARLQLGDMPFTLIGEEAWSRNIQVFAPRGATILCAEPVSHVPDAANRPQLARFGAMRRLARGESITGRAVLRAGM